MTNPVTSDRRHFEDLAIGDIITLGHVTVTKDMIVTFAREFDPFPFHLDEAAARAVPGFVALVRDVALRQGRAEAWQALSLPPAASQLIALEARANAVSLWWTEQATPADLTALQALLTDLMQRLR